MQTDWEIARQVFDITVDQANSSQADLEEWFQSSSLDDLELLINQKAEGLYLQQQKVGLAAIHMFKTVGEMLRNGDLPTEQIQATLSIGTAAIDMLVCNIQTAVNLATEIRKRKATILSRMKATKGHSAPGGYREKKEKVLQAWASGIYKTHVQCAAVESIKCGVEYGTAITYLRNAPTPVGRVFAQLGLSDATQ